MTPETKLHIDINAFNEHHAYWMQVAKANGWYCEPFYIQVWVEHDGSIADSVAMRSMDSHIAIRADTDMFLCTFTKPFSKNQESR